MSLETLWEAAAVGNAAAADVLAWYRHRRQEPATATTGAAEPAAEPADEDTLRYAFEFEIEDPKALLAKLNADVEPVERARRQVALFRALAAIDPEQYSEPLAAWLGGHGYELFRRNRYAEAVAEFREAYALPGLDDERRGQLREALTRVLETTWTALLEAGRLTEAAPFLRESGDLLNDDPAERARVLSYLAAALADTDPGAALAAVTESGDLRRALGDQAGLALCRNNQGDLNLRRGNAEAARQCLTEAVAIRRSLARHDPATYLAPLYRSLSGLALTLRTLGRDQEARAAEAELAELARAFRDQPRGRDPRPGR